MKIFLSLFLLLLVAPVMAADWQVSRVRGTVTQNISGSWQPVSRGDLIPANRYLKTGPDGRVGLARGKETIELQGDTQIRIRDAGDELMTSVLQDFGEVSIEAERRNVQHFSVQTPFLAAVVKGTRFTVRSNERGSTVDVNRGVVQVQDSKNQLVVDVRPGQEASVGEQTPLVVEGAGAINVYSFEGVPVVNGTTTEISDDISDDDAAVGKRNGNGNAFGLSKNLSSDGVNARAGNNAGGNGIGNAFGLSKDNSSGNNAGGNAGVNSGNNAANANANAAANANANSAVARAQASVTDEGISATVDAVGLSVGVNVGSGNNGNGGGNGLGNALGHALGRNK